MSFSINQKLKLKKISGSNLSSGSGNSNDSIEKINRHHSKV